jgi:hypothetical protein
MSAPNVSFDLARLADDKAEHGGQSGQGPANGGGHQSPTPTYQQLSAFAFPVVQTSATTFQPPPSFHQLQTPKLNPAVESTMASYLAQNAALSCQGMGGPAQAPQVPNDYLSRVLSYSWENNNQYGGDVQGVGHLTGNMLEVGAMIPFEEWGSGGWMA